MKTLIVDIETKAEAWQTLPGITRASLTRAIDLSGATETEKQRKRDEVLSRLSLSPFTGSIISLAVYDVGRGEGAVYYVDPHSESETAREGDFMYKVRTEQALLADFWTGAVGYEVFVTFNGRSFVLPFLYHRSIIQGVKPTCAITKELYIKRQTAPFHIDLLDEFSFYGAMAHRPSLQLLCGAFGLPNESILGGEEIAEAYDTGRYRLIAEKNVGDVRAITELYTRWQQFLAPESFSNIIEN